MVGNSRVAVGKSNEQYPGGDNNRQPINYNGEQKVSKVQTNAQYVYSIRQSDNLFDMLILQVRPTGTKFFCSWTKPWRYMDK